MTQHPFTVLPGLAGPRPTLPPGGRMGDVSRRSHERQNNDAVPRSDVSCAHPGSGAALCQKGGVT